MKQVANPKLLYFQQIHVNQEINVKVKQFEAFRENAVSSTIQTGDFYHSVRHLLQFGRIVGIIPISGLWSKSECLQYKWNTLAATTSIAVSTALSINIIFSFLNLFRTFTGTGGGNAVDLVFSARGPLFSLTVLFIYIFFQVKVKKLIALFSCWRKVSVDVKLKTCDIKLSQSINMFAFSIYLSALIENVLKHLTLFPVVQHSTNGTNNTLKNYLKENETVESALEIYYFRSHPSWTLYVDYHPVLVILLLICNLISVNAWNYADVIIIAFSRALYFKFKALVESTDERLVADNQSLFRLHGTTWAEVRREHLILCKLLDEFEVFLSPLIFLSYTINIFFICLQLHQGLTPHPHRTSLDSISSMWSLVHLIFRTMVMSITASKINEYAHQISVPIQKCASTEYCKEVERLESMLGTGPLIGLTCLGCFVLTKAFILMVLSVIFTMEIVLLQTSATKS